MSQIGGSQRVREDLEHALEIGRKVTAKVQWISKPAQNTRSRWIHCTPLLGINGLIAVWMVILVDDFEDEKRGRAQVPVTSPASTEAGTSISEVLPWEAAEEPGLSGTVGNGFGEGSRSSNTSQAALSSDGGRNSYDPTPPVPERNRLRKGRSNNVRLHSKASKDSMMDATISPFAAEKDTRYKVKVWSEAKADEPKQSMDENTRPRTARPKFGQPPDIVGGSGYPPFAVRPGPRIHGQAYSFNSNSEHGISADDEGATGATENDRPISRGSSFTPATRNNGHPAVAPIHMPGKPASDAQDGGDGRPLARRTYKSLSPYGILFQN